MNVYSAQTYLSALNPYRSARFAGRMARPKRTLSFYILRDQKHLLFGGN